MEQEFIQKDREFSEIRTERTVLKAITEQNAQDILKACTLAVCEYFDEPIHQDINEVHKQIKDWEQEKMAKKAVNIAIYDMQENFIGDTEIRHIDTGDLSVGIWLDEAHQNQGLGREVVGAVITWIRNNLHFSHIKRESYKDNLGSIKIIESLGGVLVDTKKTKHRKHGEIDDCVYHIYPNS